MVKVLLADNFYPKGDAEAYWAAVAGLQFVEKEYGQEIDHFNMIFPGVEPILSKVIGEPVKVDKDRSGVFRRPMGIVHFEGFDSLDEWCFVVALEKTTFNIYHHLKDGQYGNIDAWSALDGYQFNYRNLFEWDVNINIQMEPNQGIFFRPWMFHTFQNGIVQYYRLLKGDECNNNNTSSSLDSNEQDRLSSDHS